MSEMAEECTAEDRSRTAEEQATGPKSFDNGATQLTNTSLMLPRAVHSDAVGGMSSTCPGFQLTLLPVLCDSSFKRKCTNIATALSAWR
ncbi:unnamed protein product [Toxocara canis]|uniref:Uncharacterized protein n=1 Tax=Toxocara canis TaxID=6265 RepID=A0A183U9J4_TOXCA|nr:unnamed protein product [Toxocara canis]